MNNIELVAYIYWGGWVTTFLGGALFITDRTEDWEEDVLASSLVALAWPPIVLFVSFVAVMVFFLEWRDSK